MTLVEDNLIRPDVRVIDLETQMAERAGQEIERLLESGFDALERGLFGIHRLRDGERDRPRAAVALRHHRGHVVTGSDEHTSALQSLMRTSYAVFCLKKNTYRSYLNTFDH